MLTVKLVWEGKHGSIFLYQAQLLSDPTLRITATETGSSALDLVKAALIGVEGTKIVIHSHPQPVPKTPIYSMGSGGSIYYQRGKSTPGYAEIAFPDKETLDNFITLLEL